MAKAQSSHSQRDMHVLYVAWAYPPSNSAGVYRALATANEFIRHGCRVTVLTAGRETFEEYVGSDPSLEAAIDPLVNVVRIPFVAPSLEPDLRRWPLVRVLFPRVWGKTQALLNDLAFPEVRYGRWAPTLKKAALEIHSRDPIDLVVATADPNVDFSAAHQLHVSHRVPFVMDYRDAWLMDKTDGSTLYGDRSRQSKLEATYIGAAREIWFTNDAIRRWHRERYPAQATKMHVVPNGFDAEFAPRPHLSAASPERPLVFGYIGTLGAKSPLESFLEGWVAARRSQSESLGASTAELWGYLGKGAEQEERFLNHVGTYVDDGVTFRGPLPKAAVSEAYARFDVLLLILRQGLMTPGKVFEYMATALPIVSIHDPANTVSDILRGYPLWFPARDLQPDAVADALCRAAEAARTATREVRQQCWDFAQQFSRSRQLSPRVAALCAGSRGES